MFLNMISGFEKIMEYPTENIETENPETNTYLLFLAVFFSLLNNYLTTVLNYVSTHTCLAYFIHRPKY